VENGRERILSTDRVACNDAGAHGRSRHRLGAVTTFSAFAYETPESIPEGPVAAAPGTLVEGKAYGEQLDVLINSDHVLDLPNNESLLYRTRTAAFPRPSPACPVLESHALTFSMASLSSARFRAMRSVQADTRDALQLHRPDLGESHVDPS
jgi:hypothetical protein